MNNKEGFARNEIAKFRDLAGENYYRVCFSKFFVSNEISLSIECTPVLLYFSNASRADIQLFLFQL